MNTALDFNLDKMDVELVEGKATYKLKTNDQRVAMNNWLGRTLKLHFQGEIYCIHCQKKTAKSYSGGHCYRCSITLAACDMCILKPETCHYDRGTCREPEWGVQNCMIPHYVYLANSSGLKVGITRTSQIPNRWIDQGAIAALPILQVSTRYQSGLIEKMFAAEVKDRTDWRAMLSARPEEIDLENARDELFELFGDDLDYWDNKFGNGQMTVLEKGSPVEIEYPVETYPEKVVSLSPEKSKIIGGKLLGIKGQYLIFETGVINIRSYTGYKVKLELS